MYYFACLLTERQKLSITLPSSFHGKGKNKTETEIHVLQQKCNFSAKMLFAMEQQWFFLTGHDTFQPTNKYNHFVTVLSKSHFRLAQFFPLTLWINLPTEAFERQAFTCTINIALLLCRCSTATSFSSTIQKNEVFNITVVIAKKKKVMALNSDRVQTQTSDIPLH